MDFDDLLLRLYRLLDRDPNVRERIAGRFQYVLVDEYQDTNPLQAAIVRLLAGAQQNVLVVGDDAQSIYSFRAADVRNILDFPKLYPGAKVFRLETNYRSTPEILALANDVIARNREQFPKELKSVKESDAKPVVAPAGSATQEAAFIADRVGKLLDTGVLPTEIAVLFRATFHSQALEFELMKRGIEYDYRGGLKFFDRAHVKDALAFVRIAANFQDEAAWLRVLGLQEGVGDVMASKIFVMMRSAGSLAHAVLAPVEQTLGARAAKGWRSLLPILEEIQAADGKPAAVVKAVIESSYVDYLENQFPNWRERLEDVGQLKSFAEDYTDAAALLAEITLDDSTFKSGRGDASRRIPKIALSTIHQAKGLEWDTVFLIHLTNSSFPNRKAALEQGGMEEERRLFYVAVTRAKRHLYLTYPSVLGRDSFSIEQPSSFLEECDPHCLDMGLVERSGWGFSGGSGLGGGAPRASSWNGDDSDAGGFHEDEAVDVDSSDPFGAMKSRLKTVDKEWKKKSFLRDI
jgi:DNA helicase-2/ATP-dependent DNA helicase PcrA